MQAAGLFKRRLDGVRVLAKGEFSAKVSVQVTGASNAAIAAVEKAGGSLTVTAAGDRPAPDGKAKPKPETAEAKPAAAKADADAPKPKAKASKPKSDAADPKQD